MKTFAKKILQSSENNAFLFKRTLLALSLLMKIKKQDCEYFRAWVISNYYNKYKAEINYVFNLDMEKNKSEYIIAKHLADKLYMDYQMQITN